MREYREDYVQGLHQRIAELEENLAGAVELDVENAQLRRALARLTAAASKVWPSASGHYAREELGGRLRELSDAMVEATAALGGNDETL